MSSKDYRKALDMLKAQMDDTIIIEADEFEFCFQFLKRFFATQPKFDEKKFQKYWDTLCKK